ncbi:MAG: ATP-binding cassette domain-containing protein [Anaeroplasma bactoclasticum]|nr:ATP-binding cassette domain-containing protein [Anaeroplasma bactoclasticum]
MIIELKNIKKIYDKNGIEVVKDFNLTIEDKEFIVFVGPSGCGKSTTLRMIAGLESITAGELTFDGKVMNNIAPGDRNVAMVFQSYALYPNMTVYKNMEFPLKIRKNSIKLEDESRTKNPIQLIKNANLKKKRLKALRDEKIRKVSEMLGLTEYLDRKPKNLSGGQRQRVALGREIVRDVDLFLMDEPLSNLDAKLRVQMRAEITKLHKELQKTFIYVTHDQIEAMTMADRIVIMKDGIVQQVGTPKEVYDTPYNKFVAGFIGTPAMNFIQGQVDQKGYFITADLKLKVPEKQFSILKEQDYLDKDIILGIRPEDIIDNKEVFESSEEECYKAKIDIAELLGSEYNLLFEINQTQITSKTKAIHLILADQEIKLHFDMNKCHFFDVETTKRIH